MPTVRCCQHRTYDILALLWCIEIAWRGNKFCNNASNLKILNFVWLRHEFLLRDTCEEWDQYTKPWRLFNIIWKCFQIDRLESMLRANSLFNYLFSLSQCVCDIFSLWFHHRDSKRFGVFLSKHFLFFSLLHLIWLYTLFVLSLSLSFSSVFKRATFLCVRCLV